MKAFIEACYYGCDTTFDGITLKNDLNLLIDDGKNVIRIPHLTHVRLEYNARDKVPELTVTIPLLETGRKIEITPSKSSKSAAKWRLRKNYRRKYRCRGCQIGNLVKP